MLDPNVLDPENTAGESDEDDVCDLDPTKLCDNCMKCVFDADFTAIQISGFELEGEHDEQ